MGATPNPADVEDGLDQVGNLESAVEPMPTFTSVNPAPCRVGPPHSGFYRSRPSQGNQKCRREPPAPSVTGALLRVLNPHLAIGDWPWRNVPRGHRSVARLHLSRQQTGAAAPEKARSGRQGGAAAPTPKAARRHLPVAKVEWGCDLCQLGVCA